MLATENPCALADTSGSGNNATGCVSTSPTIIPVTGGISCAGTGAVGLPAALNGAKTFQIFMSANVGATNNLSLATFLASVKDQVIIGGNGALANSAFWRLFQSTVTDTWGQETQGGARFRSGNGVGSAYLSGPTSPFSGTNSAAFVMNAPDIFYVGASVLTNIQTGSSIGVQTVGNFQLCGITAKFLTANVYYLLVYNRALTAAEVAQNAQFMQNAMAARGVFVSSGGTDNIDQFVPAGDSITSAVNWPSDNLVGNFAVSDQGVSGTGILSEGAIGNLSVDPYFRKNAARNITSSGWGANDTTNGATLEAQLAAGFCRQRRAAGWKCGVGTMISHTGSEAFKDAYNAILRQQVPTNFDFIVDHAANVNFGADGACSNATYFNVDCIHPTAFAEKYIYGANYIHAYNRAGGNPNGPGIYKGTGTTLPFRVNLQNCISASGGGTSVSCTFGFPVTAGNFIFAEAVCAVSSGTTITLPFTDTRTSTWNTVTAATAQHAGDSQTVAQYAMNITGGAETITANFNQSCPNPYLRAQEYAGVLTAAALDVTSVGAVGSSTAPASAAVTTTGSNELMISYIGGYGGPGQITAGNSSAPVTPLADTHAYLQDRIAPTAGSYTGSATFSISDSWTMATAAFKSVAGTTNIPIQDADCVYTACYCDPSGGNVNLLLPDASWDTVSTLTIKNIQTAGANTCTVSAITPPSTGVAQQIDGAASVTIANKATLRLKPILTFTGVAGTNLSPVVNWIALGNN